MPASTGVEPSTSWDEERRALLGRRISDLGLAIKGSRVERLVNELYQELDAKGIAFRPLVYLSDEWGCPDETPLIGVPFYLVDPRLERIEREMSGGVEDDLESMRYLRHECGHAFNYAFRLYRRPDWRSTFGSFGSPYRERYRADPLSHAYVRHILGWYAQKHPDEDFAETFAVWLTPALDWRSEYAGWEAMAKLEYVDAVMREIGSLTPSVTTPSEKDLPIEAMTYTVAEHYESEAGLTLSDPRLFDADLRRIFAPAEMAPGGMPAAAFIQGHYNEILARLSYWSGESRGVVRSLIDLLVQRSAAMQLRVSGLEASTLIELTAFGTAVLMNYRHTRTLDRRAAQAESNGGNPLSATRGGGPRRSRESA